MTLRRKIVAYLRPGDRVARPYWRLVYLTNGLSILLAGLTLGLLFILLYLYGWSPTTKFIISVAVLFLTIPVLNNYVSHLLGRLFFCLMPVCLIMFITIYGKLYGGAYTYIVYFDSRYLLLAMTVLPGLVFRLDERIPFLVSVSAVFVCLIFFDPLHSLFGVGFYQTGFSAYSYYYINYVAAVAFLSLVLGVYLLRSVMERGQQELEGRNLELKEKSRELSNKHEELLRQQQELLDNREMLAQANRIIIEQQYKLESYNASLEALVEEKSKELQHSNEELVKHNNELVQFSYTVSHNLRGPVARLLGLSQLMQRAGSGEEREVFVGLIRQSSQELDEILKDLSMIIDIRNDIYRVREKIYLQDEWQRVLGLLRGNIRDEYQIDVDFSYAPFVYGVRPMVQSILYNLASNAIKYQDASRLLQVTIRSSPASEVHTLLTVADNGLGIDLEAHGDKLFKLYRRLHTHISGKGLGLYLVKTQAEAMGATLSVQSEVGRGSTFTVTFSQPDGVGRQVFYESDASDLYYDAEAKITVIIWKRSITSKEYRATWEAVLNSFRLYRNIGWISDLRNQGVVSSEDQTWFAKTIIPEAIRAGLKRVGTVGFDDEIRSEYWNRMSALAKTLNVDLRVFPTLEEANVWIMSEPGS